MMLEVFFFTFSAFCLDFEKHIFCLAKFFLSLEKFVAQLGKNFAKIQKKLETMPGAVPWLNCHL